MFKSTVSVVGQSSDPLGMIIVSQSTSTDGGNLCIEVPVQELKFHPPIAHVK